MSVSTGLGRLGNQFIRNVAVSLLAEKHNLKVQYQNKCLLRQLGIELFSGSNIHSKVQPLTDNNYFTVYHCDNIDYNINPSNDFFQTKEICNFIHHYLHTDKIKSNIISYNPFRERYNTNNDLFIHIRLTDVAHYNPGIVYYINAMKQIHFDKLYISTDDKTHTMIVNLFKLYPSAELIEYDEIKTFQFGSTCQHIILSHGSFSATIGYLSFFSNIYYPEYEVNKIWYGDMCSIDGWNRLSL